METRLKDGWGTQKMANELGQHVSTIYWEKKRGHSIHRTTDFVDKECYIPEIAQAKHKDLPIKRSKDKKTKKAKPRAARNCKGKSIEERPKEVDGRETPGHWEMDTVVSKKGGSLALFCRLPSA